jgi:hypothetical protein
MSGFSDMMMDDGCSDPMDYMDYMEKKYFDKMEDEASEFEYSERMYEEGYMFIGGEYYHQDYIQELWDSGYNIVKGEVVKVFDNENPESFKSNSINDKFDESGLPF